MLPEDIGGVEDVGIGRVGGPVNVAQRGHQALPIPGVDGVGEVVGEEFDMVQLLSGDIEGFAGAGDCAGNEACADECQRA